MLSLLMLIGIVGYFCVPTVANYVVHAGGGNSILTKINSFSAGGYRETKQGTNNSIAGIKYGAGMIADSFGDGKRQMSGMAEASGQDYFKDKLSGKP